MLSSTLTTSNLEFKEEDDKISTLIHNSNISNKKLLSKSSSSLFLLDSFIGNNKTPIPIELSNLGKKNVSKIFKIIIIFL